MFQVFKIVSMAYDFTNYLTPAENDTEDSTSWKYNVLCCYTLLFNGLSIGFLVLGWVFFINP